jgi:alpha-galactosidase
MQTHLHQFRFPEGIKGTANKVHDLGFKFGIYSSAGTMTCGRYPGSIGYEAIDAETFAAWGVDYLKVGSAPSLYQ